MAEELRFFLRTALYALVISVIYWFVSYEVAGTFLLSFLVVGAVSFIAAMFAMIRAARRSPTQPQGRGLGRLADTVVGFVGFDTPGAPAEQPLEIEEDAMPASSIWPFAAALAALLVGVGLIYGAWFWIPGVAMGLSVLWGWTTQLRP